MVFGFKIFGFAFRLNLQLVQVKWRLAFLIPDPRKDFLLEKFARPMGARESGIKNHPRIRGPLGRDPDADIALHSIEKVLFQPAHDGEVIFLFDFVVRFALRRRAQFR